MGTFEGYGANVSPTLTAACTVTTLADSGTGSLRNALSASGRNINFGVEGVIYLESTIDIPSNTWISGSDAPGRGIMIATRTDLMSSPWHAMRILGSQVVLRYLRIRLFSSDTVQNTGDTLNMQLAAGQSNIMIDQCSIGWSVDENIDVGGCTDVTVQWCIIHEALQEHSTSLGALIPNGAASGVSFHHNLLAHNHGRNPRDASDGVSEFICNAVYNPGDHPQSIDNNTSVDVVKNFYKKGTDSIRNYLVQANNANSTYFISGNACDNCTGFTTINPGSSAASSATRLASPPVAITEESTAASAWTAVLNNAGATLPQRDTFDKQVVASASQGWGQVLTDPEIQIGGVCELPY